MRGFGTQKTLNSNPIVGIPAGLVLNMSFVEVAPAARAIWDSMNTNGKSTLAISSALHELGHAIGMRHEETAPDSTCVEFDENILDGVAVTKFNAFSFMSRCFYRHWNYALGPVPMNSLDIEGVNAMYSKFSAKK